MPVWNPFLAAVENKGGNGSEPITALGTEWMDVVTFGKTAENATDYSLNNTMRNTLWLPTTRKMKYLAKQAIDSFIVRLGDVGSALAVFVLGDAHA